MSFELYHVRLLLFYCKPSPSRQTFLPAAVNLLNHFSLLKVLVYFLESESCWTTRVYRKGHSFPITREGTIALSSSPYSETSLTPLEALEGSSIFFFIFYTVTDRINTLREMFDTFRRHTKEQWSQIFLSCVRSAEHREKIWILFISLSFCIAHVIMACVNTERKSNGYTTEGMVFLQASFCMLFIIVSSQICVRSIGIRKISEVSGGRAKEGRKKKKP